MDQFREEEHIGFLIRQVAHLSHQRFNQSLEKEGITAMQEGILSFLNRHHGSTQTQLKDYLLIKASSVTKLVDQLEDKGLLTRTAHPNDARIKLLQLTSTGQNLQNHLWNIKISVEAEITQNLTEDQRTAMLFSLQKMRETLINL